jgi:hypothetical protein
VTEYVETLEANGIDVPTQKRWTVRDEPRFFITTTIGEARGMFDDREVMIFIHPLLKLKEEIVKIYPRMLAKWLILQKRIE